MTQTSIQVGFAAGEISPSLFGRVDLAKWRQGASTMRNCFVNYRGGACSRAGTAFVGMCKQPGSSPYPPRDITFQFSNTQGYVLEFGNLYMRVKFDGAYVIETAINVNSVSSAALFTTSTNHGYSVGDWVFDIGNVGFNGLTWIVYTTPAANTFTVTDLFGNVVTTATASTVGTVARIYTAVSPYADVDLPYLKFTQSADTMSFACVNTSTNVDYPPYDLKRTSNTNWVFTQVTFTSSVTAPTGVTATPENSTTAQTNYSYVVTAVAPDGEESIASSPAACVNNDISVFAGSNIISWSSVSGATSYNVYKATPVYNASVPAGVLYGFMSTSTGTSAIDTNVTADFTKVPPVHTNPFPSTGNYPGCVAYYQERRGYANTMNNPDTYWFSQPGAFLNMDTSIPVSDGDAIQGTPWAQQVNGIQFMVPMPSGLVILTGHGAWLLSGGNSAAFTPITQTATPQAYNGCNNIVPPITINYNILYVQSKGSIVRDLAYNFFVNIYTGTDATVLSNQLFDDHTILQWAWSEEPFKIVWCIREDGVALSFTYLKEQDVYGWARHDTNGLYVGVTSVTEPPVDAVYFIVKRYISGVNQWAYYSERMNDRDWPNVETVWCVDAGLQWPMTSPNIILTPAAANGTQNITSSNLISGGNGYVSPTIQADDPTGSGIGFSGTLTFFGGVITGLTINNPGSGYGQGTQFIISDTQGSLAVIQPIITNIVNFVASGNVFNSGMVGQIIRAGGGKATITSYASATQVAADITQPITETIPNDPNNMPVPASPGSWTVTPTTQVVSGLNHLEGMTVAILADGSVIANQVVRNGSISLPQPYSSIVVGLPFLAQLQTLYLEPAGQQNTVQSKRKNIYSVGVRVQSSRGISVGTNQPDASTQPNNATVAWTNLKEIKERNALVNAGSAIPLFTGDWFINIPANWDTSGQIAIQQNYPLPMNILAVVSYFKVGDTSDNA